MIEGGVEARMRDGLTVRRESIDQHLAARVVAHQRDLRESIDLRKRVGEREKRRIHVR